ncbi:hypothetical protein ACG7TL_007074 [Trametes sanguinea]
MAYVEASAAPVDACYLVKCDKCGKTTWKMPAVSNIVPRALEQRLAGTVAITARRRLEGV